MFSANLDEQRLEIVVIELEKLHPGFIEACRRQAELRAELAKPDVEPGALERNHSWFGVLSVGAGTLGQPPTRSKRKKRK